MEIRVERVQKDPDVTIGAIYTDGEFHSWCVEDTVRSPGVKVAGQTAIPAGTYTVEVTYSNRFKKPLPLLLDVPMFSGIRIHPGNGPADTEGCILPGLDRLAKSVGRSRLAFDGLFTKIKDAKARGEKVTLEIA